MPCSVTSDVVDVFMSLAAVPSPSGDERAVADLVAAYLRELGLEVSEDDAASSLRGNAGNLYCRVPASGDNGGLPLFFCAHIDTVPPDAPIEPVIAHGTIRNSAPTILGADNKASVAVMLEAVRQLVSEGRPHAGVELVITVQEEVG